MKFLIKSFIVFSSKHFLWYLISDKLSTRLDKLQRINLNVSINFILYVIVSLVSSIVSFLIGIEKLIYFSLFSAKHLKSSPLNSSANSLIIK